MPDRSLDFRIFYKGIKRAEINDHADPGSYESMQKVLRKWLAGQKWDQRLWGRFEAEVRYAGEARIRARVIP